MSIRCRSCNQLLTAAEAVCNLDECDICKRRRLVREEEEADDERRRQQQVHDACVMPTMPDFTGFPDTSSSIPDSSPSSDFGGSGSDSGGGGGDSY